MIDLIQTIDKYLFSAIIAFVGWVWIIREVGKAAVIVIREWRKK